VAVPAVFVYRDLSIAFSAMSCSICRDGLRDHTHVAMVHLSGVGIIVNPRHACAERITVVVLCVYLSVTTQTATYLVYILKIRCR
jgi:hypothetical protein